MQSEEKKLSVFEEAQIQEDKPFLSSGNLYTTKEGRYVDLDLFLKDETLLSNPDLQEKIMQTIEYFFETYQQKPSVVSIKLNENKQFDSISLKKEERYNLPAFDNEWEDIKNFKKIIFDFIDKKIFIDNKDNSTYGVNNVTVPMPKEMNYQEDDTINIKM